LEADLTRQREQRKHEESERADAKLNDLSQKAYHQGPLNLVRIAASLSASRCAGGEISKVAGRQARQRDQRYNSPTDDVPIANGERQYRLDVQDVRGLVMIGPTPKNVLFWNGRLYIAATGFWAAAASAWVEASVES
jgi:hypothetical protein